MTNKKKTNTFGQMLTFYRKKKGWTQQQLAERVGVSDATIGTYERGEREPSFETEETLADLFNVSILTLRGFNDDPQTVSLLSAFNQLNKVGRTEALKRVEELAMIKTYINNEED